MLAEEYYLCICTFRHTGSGLVRLLKEQVASHYLCELFISSNPDSRSKANNQGKQFNSVIMFNCNKSGNPEHTEIARKLLVSIHKF